MIPILCVGETLEQRERGDTEAVIGRQLDAVLSLAGVAALRSAVLAYEPVWAIGTGKTASSAQAQAVHLFLRERVAKLDQGIAAGLTLLYGGSVKPGNAAELFAQPESIPVPSVPAATDALPHQVLILDEVLASVDRSYPLLIAAREFLARGDFGPVLQATANCGQPFHVFRPAYAQTYYRDHATGGGAIQDALTHVANWIESVLGPTESVLCDCAHLSLPDVNVEDTVHVSARHGGGRVLVNYTLNQFQAPNEITLQFNAAGGSVKIEFHRQRWGTFPAGASDWTWHEVPPVERDAHFIAQANAFLDQIEGRPSRLCSLEAAAQTLRFNLAALASAKRGARVSCAELSGDA